MAHAKTKVRIPLVVTKYCDLELCYDAMVYPGCQNKSTLFEAAPFLVKAFILGFLRT